MAQNANLQNTTSLQEQVFSDNNLINAGLPQNNLNSLIALAKEKLSCDSDCQQKRSAQDYKKQWELAKQQYKDAPEQIQLAEKNYYIYDKGYPAYKEMLYDRYSKTAEEFKKASNIKYKNNNEEMTVMIDSYDASTTYFKRMNELLNIKLTDNERLKSEIDQYNTRTQTDSRKVIYEDRERDWLNTVRKIILFFYFCCLILYIVIGKFIPNKEYLQWKIWVYIILYIIFPFFILDKIVSLFFYIFNYVKLLNLIKNVYKHL